MNIRLVDFPRVFGRYRECVEQEVANAAQTGEFILKRKVRDLEHAICHQTGAAYAVAVANATGGIQLLMHALAVGPETNVVLPAFGFPSPANCALNLGARPVFVDVERDGGMIDPCLLSRVIDSRTRAIVPMHLGRALADMTAVRAVADSSGIAVIEDSAVAMGSTINGRPAGRMGRAGVYSFYPTKPLGGIGDGGMLITDDEALAVHCRRLRNHGQEAGERFLYREAGYNCRMDEVAAAFLLARLTGFDARILRRQKIAAVYDDAFTATSNKVVPMLTKREDACHHLYVVLVNNPGDLRVYLQAFGIESNFFHPIPLHLQPAYAHLGYHRGDFPVAEWLADHALMLPFFPEMEDAEVEYVAQKVVSYAR